MYVGTVLYTGPSNSDSVGRRTKFEKNLKEPHTRIFENMSVSSHHLPGIWRWPVLSQPSFFS